MFAPFPCAKCSSNLFLGTWDYTQGKWLTPWAVSPAPWVSFILRLLYSFCIHGPCCAFYRQTLLFSSSFSSPRGLWWFCVILGSPPVLPFLLLLRCSARRKPCSLVSPLISYFFFFLAPSFLTREGAEECEGALSLHWVGTEETMESRDHKGQEGWAHTY